MSCGTSALGGGISPSSKLCSAPRTLSRLPNARCSPSILVHGSSMPSTVRTAHTESCSRALSPTSRGCAARLRVCSPRRPRLPTTTPTSIIVSRSFARSRSCATGRALHTTKPSTRSLRSETSSSCRFSSRSVWFAGRSACSAMRPHRSFTRGRTTVSASGCTPRCRQPRTSRLLSPESLEPVRLATAAATGSGAWAVPRLSGAVRAVMPRIAITTVLAETC